MTLQVETAEEVPEVGGGEGWGEEAAHSLVGADAADVEVLEGSEDAGEEVLRGPEDVVVAEDREGSGYLEWPLTVSEKCAGSSSCGGSGDEKGGRPHLKPFILCPLVTGSTNSPSFRTSRIAI